MRSKRLSTRIRVLVIALIIMNISVLAASFIQLRRISADSVERTFEEVTQSTLRHIIDELNLIDRSVNDLRGAIQVGLDHDSISRGEVVHLLWESLERNENIIGHAAVFEDDAFDGMDAKFINDGQVTGSDHEGRFVAYTYRKDDALFIEPILDFEIEGYGDWYLVPKYLKEPFITEPYYFPIGEDMVYMVTIAYPIFRGERFIGVATADIDIRYLQDSISHIDAVNDFDGYAALFSRNRTVLAHSSKPENISKWADDVLPIRGKNIESNRLSVLEIKWFEGLNSSWGFYISVPEDLIYAEFRDIVRLSNIALVVMMFLSLVFVEYIVRSIKRPIKEIEIATEHITKRAYDQPLTMLSYDEFNELGNKFEKMRQDIISYQHQLEASNETLEYKVEERTLELNSKNQELLATITELSEKEEELITMTEELLLTNLLAGISHEINTPLGNALTGMSYMEFRLDEFLIKCQEEACFEDKRKDAEAIQQSLTLLKRNIDLAIDKLNFFKKFSKKDDYSIKEIFPIGQTFDSVLEVMQHDLHNKKITFKLDIKEEHSVYGYVPDYIEMIKLSIHYALLLNEELGVNDYDFVIQVTNRTCVDFILRNVTIEQLGMDRQLDFFKSLRGKKQKDYIMALLFRLVTDSLKGHFELFEKERHVIVRIEVNDMKK